MPVRDEIRQFEDEMVSWRRDLHAHPELGFAENRTSAFIQERLKSLAVDEIHGFTGTGVVAVIRGRDGDGAIGLRADIDALPIPEESGVPHASTNPGVMHACGHDGHTTMLLGAAKYLAASRKFKGTAYLIFQPAEEIGGGPEGLGNAPGQPADVPFDGLADIVVEPPRCPSQHCLARNHIRRHARLEAADGDDR